jgi:prephenate dehydrogenase
MGDGALWVDTLSVKTGIAPILEIHSERIEALSINPMFAPGLGWNAKPVAVVPFRSGTKASRFLELLSSWGARIEMLSADRHDRITSTIQAATHAAVLAFGASLLSLEYDAEAALRLATPPHRILLGLLARMLAQNPEVYWDIQAHHPHATRVRSELISCLQRLDDASREPSPEHFDTLFGRLKDLLRSQQPELTDLARRLVNAVVQDR